MKIHIDKIYVLEFDYVQHYFVLIEFQWDI